MFVITADQVDSRSGSDLVVGALRDLAETIPAPILAAERTVGDEFQLLLTDHAEALDVILRLTRSDHWSVGCGVGTVHLPLPNTIREASGPAFVAARTAVDRAKKRPTRFALDGGANDVPTRDAEALVDLLLILRSRRSPEGWELDDLLATGMSQADAASALGITPQAVSLRARAAELRADRLARKPLERILQRLDTLESTASGGHP
ncbi:hypothetical protein BKA04_000334 [Cryobacterium mesophilum]|uniref:DNA-binding protein n=1 Tax=Terrimesophilobacter mesophilus TaxID=433647 RepID=A0A4R8VAD8_9MICO|nr:DNA-binding protein [Terrimesophilobacter mesophilus]MBB5632111.1 hypothetical protein [Terrimesophilobacter mesophilus]TFB78982.1 DNA-binding protein [Terrimesophilobacter mesophilus]